jgi:transposase
MEKIPVYVGLDYHQHSIQVCIVDRAGKVLRNRSVGNSLLEVTDVAAECGEVAGATVEACCGSADLAERLEQEARWPVVLAHPGYVSRMKHNPDKTDLADARVLAELCRTGFVPRVWLAPRPLREMRSLVRYRQQMVQMRRAAKVRMLAVLREHRVALPKSLRRWGKGFMAWLEALGAPQIGEGPRWILDRHLRWMHAAVAEVAQIDDRLTRLTANDPVVQRLLTFKGFGPVTAWTMRAEVGWFDRFKNGKQLARYCGLSPCNASSGEKMADAGLIRAGNGPLKAVLVEAAHRLIRYVPRWRDLAAKLRARGKPGSVIAAAVANRFVRGLHHEMKTLTIKETTARAA